MTKKTKKPKETKLCVTQITNVLKTMYGLSKKHDEVNELMDFMRSKGITSKNYNPKTAKTHAEKKILELMSVTIGYSVGLEMSYIFIMTALKEDLDEDFKDDDASAPTMDCKGMQEQLEKLISI